MSNTNIINHMEANIIGNELILTWKKKGEFHSGITFEWRNQLIHMKVDVNTYLKSRTDTITINRDGITYYFGVGRATIGAGIIGVKPKIQTSENYLTFIQQENKVTIKDNPKTTINSIHNNTNIFKVINNPSIFSFINKRAFN